MPLTLTQLRKTVAEMDAPELRGPMEELFRANVTNKRLLTALLEGDSSDLLAKLDSELLKAFWDEGGLPTMKVGGAKKALAAYLKVATPMQALGRGVAVRGGRDSLPERLRRLAGKQLQQHGKGL
ncbi:hypothetical protein [Deinococcus arenicola]|uniref:Uncharacterized protein n=1 Tax=Deinococcus arenicola TaxID=2994950 RepID=A0ABU4DT75_9DEIO|nr:hypothetical protein [Deinococcus sp. ZS9-10]MDV6375639.1 hypothetical protein [Deinococcus sp. ZS9-10]